MLALVSGDEDVLKKNSIPHKDLGILLSANRPPPEAVAQMKEMFGKLPLTQLKIGDSIKLPNGKEIIMNETHISEDRVMLNFPNNPLPFQLVRKENKWRVNPKPLISARKAAAASKRKQATDP